jgi:hypothetical protein
MTTAFRNSAAALLVALLALRAGPARAQGAAAGGEVLVSFAGIQPSVAADSRGGFVLVWADEGQGGILASVLPKGESHPRPPLVVSAPTGRPQVNPDVAANAGRFAVVWQDGEDFGGVPEAGGSRVVGRGFGPRAIPHFPQVRLSREEEGQQAHPQVAVEANGDFVAAWAVIHDEGAEIKAARFSGTGSPLGPEMEMKTQGEENVGVYVAAFPAGFAVGWGEFSECSGGRPAGFVSAVARFDTEGRRLGRVYRAGTSRCSSPDAAAIRALVGSRAGVLALFASSRDLVQRFAPSSEPVGGLIRLPSPPCNESQCASIGAFTMDNFGRFAVIWEVDAGGSSTLAAQLFNPRGKPLTGLVPVSDTPSVGFQTPAAALADDGTLAVVWRREDSSHPENDGLFLRLLQLP